MADCEDLRSVNKNYGCNFDLLSEKWLKLWDTDLLLRVNQSCDFVGQNYDTVRQKYELIPHQFDIKTWYLKLIL